MLTQSLILGFARCTRWLQHRFASPVRGLTRLSSIISVLFPPFATWVKLPDGFAMYLNTAVGTERNLLFYGLYHPVSSWITRQWVHSGNYCLDIGANLGYYGLLMGKLVGSDGQIACLEANPSLAARLNEHIAYNQMPQVQVIAKAVSDSNGTAAFYLAKDVGKSSLHVQQAEETILVETITIDELITQLGWQRLDFIKLDIEGFDVRALLGAKEALRRFRPTIVFEYWRTTGADNSAKLASLFAELGYQLQTLAVNGKKTPFNWQVEGMAHHVDVFAIPMS